MSMAGGSQGPYSNTVFKTKKYSVGEDPLKDLNDRSPEWTQMDKNPYSTNVVGGPNPV